MTVSDIRQIVLTIIASVGGAGVIIIGISTWLGKVWADRIYLRTGARHQKEIEELKNQYSVELERLRSEIAERRDFMNTLFSILSSGYSSSYERILSAIETLWMSILEIRELASMLLFMHTVIYPSEFETVPPNKIADMMPDTTEAKYAEQMQAINQKVNDRRPFFGENLWRLYGVYNAFVVRLAWKAIRCKATQKFYPWDKDFDGKTDEFLFDILRSALAEEELQAIIGEGPLRVPQRIMGALEVKILIEMNELTFGRKLIDVSLEEHQRISSFLGSVGFTSKERAA